MRPIIGITTSSYERDFQGVTYPASLLNETYSRAVCQAGGLPLLLANTAPFEEVDALLARLDGLILSGGVDVDPACWGEAPHPQLGMVDRVRDGMEMALVQGALKRDMPVFGICRGIQVLNVALGGSLWQDLPAQVPENVGHRQQLTRDLMSHDVTIAEDSELARILWPVPTDDAGRLQVNSFHHQATREVGSSLQPVAWSDDGLIEALVIPEAHFVLGVQWHPEDLAAGCPQHAALFAACVRAAAAYAARIPGPAPV